MKAKIRKKTLADRTFYVVGYLLLGLFTMVIIVPIVYVLIASFMDPTVLQNQGISFDFSTWSTDAYRRVFENRMIWIGFKNSLVYSVSFTVISVGITILAAYPMSKKDLVGKKFFNAFFVITMFFGGGLVPTYLLISDLNMLVY